MLNVDDKFLRLATAGTRYRGGNLAVAEAETIIPHRSAAVPQEGAARALQRCLLLAISLASSGPCTAAYLIRYCTMALEPVAKGKSGETEIAVHERER